MGRTELWKPRPYQERGLTRILAEDHGMLLWDPGLGKTSTVLAAIRELIDSGKIETALVVAPIRVCSNVWPVEAAHWKQFAGLKISVCAGLTAEKRKTAALSYADIYVINPESLESLLSIWQGWVPDMLVVDESTKFKAGKKAKRFRALAGVLPRFKRRYCLTGTPAPNSLLDLWAQAYICDLGDALGRYVTHFKNKYFWQTGYGGYTLEPKDDAEEKIYAAMRGIADRIDREDHLTLPDLIITDIDVDLPAGARRQYNTMATHLIAQIDKGEIVAASAAAATMKLRQLCNGAVYDEEREVHKVHDAKIVALADHLETQGRHPTIIVYEFQHDLQGIEAAIASAWGKDARVETLSGASAKRSTAMINAWNAGELDALLLHPDAGGHGLNLQDGGHRMVWFGLTWKLEAYQQTIARLWRSGQEKTTYVYRIRCRDTVDSVVCVALEAKNIVQSDLLSALKTHLR